MSNGTVKSRADEMFRLKMSLPPEVTPNMAKVVSAERRELLGEELERGAFRNKNQFMRNSSEEVSNVLTSAGTVVTNARIKYGSDGLFGDGHTTNMSTVSGGSGGWRGPNNGAVQTPEIYSPLWLNSNLNLPRDRATINAWSRSFFALNPIVHNAITLHSTYPIAKLNIKCKDQKVEAFFSAMIEETDLMNVCVQIAQEFWTLGEAFVYGELDDKTLKWSKFLIQNPDYVAVKRSVVSSEPIISLRPDQNLKRLVFSTSPADAQQRAQLDPSIVEHVRKGQNVPLNNFYVSHLARKTSQYEDRGTSIIVNIFRQLMLFDQLRESKFVQAQGMINPLTLIKIGSAEFRPTPADLDQWRNTFEQVQYDKDAKVFTHDAVNVERVGFASGIYDISGDITQLIKEIYIGLMVPSVIMDGSDSTYATGSVSLDVLRQRYTQFRNMLAAWLKRKIFAPISKLNEFYEWDGGQKRLIIPEVDWNHMSLFDMSDYISNLIQLSAGEGAAQKVSQQTMYRSLGLDYEDEQRKMRYEDIQNTIRQKELVALQNYPLTELRSLASGEEIEEKEPAAAPGEDPYEEAVPGQETAAADGGLDNFGGDGGFMPPAPIGGGGMSPPRSSPEPDSGSPPGGGTGIGAGGEPMPT
jgi:hypothetical protein